MDGSKRLLLGQTVGSQNIPVEIRGWVCNALDGKRENLIALKNSQFSYDQEVVGLGSELNPMTFNLLVSEDETAVHVFWKTKTGMLYESSLELPETTKILNGPGKAQEDFRNEEWSKLP